MARARRTLTPPPLPSAFLSREFKIQNEVAQRQAPVIADALAEKLLPLVQTFAAAPRQQAEPGERMPTQTLLYVPQGTGTTGVVWTVASESAIWPLSVHCRLTTSAVVATRTLAIEYQSADGDRFDLYGTQAGTPANDTQHYIWHHAQGASEWPVEDAALATLGKQHLYPGQRLAIVVANGDAGDVIDQVRLSVRVDPLG